MSRLLLSIILAATVLSCSGDEDIVEPPLPDISAEFDLLQSSTAYIPACCCRSNEVTIQAKAYRTILDHPLADNHFKQLLSSPGMPAQLYGLAGVYYTDPATLSGSIWAYLESEERVETVLGDVTALIPVSVVAGEIESGEVPEDLREAVCLN